MSFAQTAFQAISGGIQSLGQGPGPSLFQSLGGAAGVGSLVSATLGAAGAFSEASAKAAAAKQDAALARRQATISRQNATIIASQTQQAARQADRERRLRIGAIVAKGGATGAGYGSMLDVLSDVAAESELERQNILYQGSLQQRGEFLDAQASDIEGQLALNRASAAKSAGRLSAAKKLAAGGLGVMDARSRLGLV